MLAVQKKCPLNFSMCPQKLAIDNEGKYIPSTLETDHIFWQESECSSNIKSWFESWVIYFTFQVYLGEITFKINLKIQD